MTLPLLSGSFYSRQTAVGLEHVGNLSFEDVQPRVYLSRDALNSINYGGSYGDVLVL